MICHPTQPDPTPPHPTQPPQVLKFIGDAVLAIFPVEDDLVPMPQLASNGTDTVSRSAGQSNESGAGLAAGPRATGAAGGGAAGAGEDIQGSQGTTEELSTTQRKGDATGTARTVAGVAGPGEESTGLLGRIGLGRRDRPWQRGWQPPQDGPRPPRMSESGRVRPPHLGILVEPQQDAPPRRSDNGAGSSTPRASEIAERGLPALREGRAGTFPTRIASSGRMSSRDGYGTGGNPLSRIRDDDGHSNRSSRTPSFSGRRRTSDLTEAERIEWCPIACRAVAAARELALAEQARAERLGHVDPSSPGPQSSARSAPAPAASPAGRESHEKNDESEPHQRCGGTRPADAVPLRSIQAVHAGEVTYGNVGALERLDFTVLGSAVNAASRIASVCGARNERTLLSRAVAEMVTAGAQAPPAGGGDCLDHLAASRPLLPLAFRDCGVHTLKGIRTPMELVAPVWSDSAPDAAGAAAALTGAGQ